MNPKIPAAKTLREARNEDAIIIKIVYRFLFFLEDIIRFSSSRKKLNLGIRKQQTVKMRIKSINRDLFEITSLLLNPPERMSIMVYDLSGQANTINEIKELTKTLRDNPTKTNFVIENLFNPAKEITKNEESKAPKNPNKE